MAMASMVYVKNPNGRTYVYENVTLWNKETKKYIHRRKCIGHLGEDGKEILPNRKKGIPAKPEQPVSSEPDCACSVLTVGTSALLEHVAQETGLSSILRRVFPADWRAMLTCAYFLASEGKALCHAEKWSQRNRVPLDAPLSSQRISELLPRIRPGMQQDFFRLWSAAVRCDEYYAMDITSISSYSEAIPFVRYGYNRDGEKLPQVNLLMLTGERSHLPIGYRVMPGSIKDVNALKESLARMELAKTGRMHVVTDKGFYSKENIDALYASRYRFIVGVPFTASFAREAVEEFRGSIRHHKNYCRVLDDDLYAATKPFQWGGHRCYLHIYHDSLKAEIASKRFDRELLSCYEELKQDKLVHAHEEYYKKFFLVKDTPKRGRKVEYKEDAIQKHQQNTLGWFVLITNDIKDPSQALTVYRQKDAVEKGFDDLKNDLDMKRLRIHSEAAMDGRIFLQFLAHILVTRIKVVMNEHGWFKNHDLQEVLDEMKSIREVRMEGRRKSVTTTLTKFQSQIAQLFGLVF